MRYNRLMPRPWEYPRWRRIVMQVVMWLILGATLGLAQLISNQRARAPEALGVPMRVGSFLVRMPEGWALQRFRDQDVLGVRGVDPDNYRVLLVLIVPAPAGPHAIGPTRRITSTPQPIEFSGLHVKGKMVLEQDLQPAQGAAVPQRSVAAMAVLPSQDTIVVQLVLPPGVQVGRADTDLLKQVAAAITLSPGAAEDTDDPGP